MSKGIDLKPKGFDLPEQKSLKEELKNKKLKEVTVSQFGIEQTKDVVIALTSLANQLNVALEDGKISLLELPGFLGSLVKFPAAFTGIGEVPNELSDLDEAEKAELVQLVKDELDVAENVEAIVEQALKVAYEINVLIKLFAAPNAG